MALKILDQKPILSTKDILDHYDKMAGFRNRIQKYKTDETLGSVSKMESFATHYARSKGINLDPISATKASRMPVKPGKMELIVGLGSSGDQLENRKRIREPKYPWIDRVGGKEA